MRKRLISPVLRQHFRTAWLCLPEPTRSNLRRFIRQVREVPRLEGAYIRCPDGSRFGPLESGDGFTSLYKNDSVVFCDILLDSCLASVSPAEAIGVILHELVHARDYLAAPKKMIKTSPFEADARAWAQAIRWATAGLADETLSRQIELQGLHGIQYNLETGIEERKRTTNPH